MRLGQPLLTKRNIKTHFFGDFLSADFWQKLLKKTTIVTTKLSPKICKIRVDDNLQVPPFMYEIKADNIRSGRS